MNEPYRAGTTPRHLFVRGGEVVRELVRGETLRERVGAGWRADEAAARAIAEGLLAILVALHEAQPPELVRALEPSRVVLAAAGGVAIAEPGVGPGAAPDYRAPEQLRGAGVAASDLYAVSATLVFALTGRSPSELPQKKLAIDFRPHVRVTPKFAAWLERTLAPAPEDRFPSARAALLALRTGRSIMVVPKRTLALATALGVLVASGVAFVTFTELRELRASREAGKEGKRTATGKTVPLQRLAPRPPSRRIEATFVRAFEAHTHVIHDVAYAPDGSMLVSAAGDGTVKAWEVPSGNALRAFVGHTGRVEAVAFTRDGRTLVTAGDSTVRVWDPKTGAALRTIETGSRRLHALALPPDGGVAVSFGDDGVAKEWELATGAPKRTYSHSPGRIGGALAISPDGSRLVTGGDEPTLKVWDRASGRLVRSLVGHVATVDAVDIAPDGVTVVSAADDRTVRTWSASTGQQLRVSFEHTDEVWEAKVTRDGGSVLSTGADGVVRRAELLSGRSLGAIQLESKGSGLAVSPDGGSFAVASTNGVISLFSLGRRDLGLVVPRPSKLVADAELVKAARSEEERLTREAMLALDAWSGERLEPIEAKLRAVLAKNPRHGPAWVGLARVAFDAAYVRGATVRADGLRDADAYLDKADQVSGKSHLSLLQRARIAHARKDDDRALHAAQDAEGLAPTDPAVKVELAKLAVGRHDYELAERLVATAFSVPIGSGIAGRGYAELEDVYLARGDVKAAGTTHERRIELAPADGWAKGNYATFLVARGENERAVAMAKEALATLDYRAGHVILARALVARGVAELWDGGASASAKSDFDAALVEEPGNALALYGRGAYYRLKAIDHQDRQLARLARGDFAAAASVDPKLTIARDALAEHERVEAEIAAKKK